MTSQHTNHLITETSPYLLQHAHNPVNWYPWGKAALEKAKLEDKVILVSIGYSACHWCHVMEKESFENEETAALMNRHFINIKIDREERPDLDHIYMDAVQAMTGSGGWPLNVFLTPDAKPFYGGTYFPPVKAFNRASWREVLHSIATAWQQRRTEIESQAENLTDYISKQADFSSATAGKNGDADTAKEQCHAMFQTLMKQADTVWGGFGRAPKFPQTFINTCLLEYYQYSGDHTALEQALLSVNKMLDGGIYDQVGGGLARYSTDNEWLAPHFEKMLYDNALFILLLCDAYQVSKNIRYREAILHSIAFIQREMTEHNGGFYAALDADSEGEEGKFYVWNKSEIDKLLGEQADLFCKFYDISAAGNWEGKNILRRLHTAEAFASEKGLTVDQLSLLLNSGLQSLLQERNTRIRPSLDDKIILGWNALMIKALSRAAIVLQDDNCRQMAIRCYDFLDEHLRDAGTGGFFHTWKHSQAKYPAFLDDYAFLANSCLHLYAATFNTAYLQKAKEICSYVIEHFSDDEQVLFYYTSKQQADVIVRKKEIYDGATPSGNAVMAVNLHRLAVIFDIEAWRNRAGAMLNCIAPALEKYPSSFGVWASFFMEKTIGSREIAVTGKDAAAAAALLQADYYLPGTIVMASEKENNNFPMLVNKKMTGLTQFYLCQDYICYPSAEKPADLYQKIKGLE